KLGEFEYNRDRMEKALQYVRQYPGEFANVSMSRVIAFWTGSWQTGYGEDPFWHHLYLPLVLLGLCGLSASIARRIYARWLYLALLALYPLIYYITQPLTRYEHPIEPVLLILASFAICEASSWLSQRLTRTIAIDERTLARAGWTAVIVLVVGCGI